MPQVAHAPSRNSLHAWCSPPTPCTRYLTRSQQRTASRPPHRRPGRGEGRRAEPGRAAEHQLHHGARLLPGPARSHLPQRPRARRGRLAATCRSSNGWPSGARKRSSPAAPRWSCSSPATTPGCLFRTRAARLSRRGAGARRPRRLTVPARRRCPGQRSDCRPELTIGRISRVRPGPTVTLRHRARSPLGRPRRAVPKRDSHRSVASDK